jgi:hypothetical protein
MARQKARILLICSWELPTFWGTEKVCINMAETLGFIIGDYTIPSELPVMYITDSNNARMLLRRLKNFEGLTHRKKVRAVKQTILSFFLHNGRMKINLAHMPKEFSKEEKRYVKDGP